MKTNKTKNYDIFKYIVGNRITNKGNLKKIRDSIMKCNLLECNPLLVNEKMEIIDGQHRLHIAKELGLDVYYLKKHGLGLNDVQNLNNASKNWVLNDYLHSFCEMEYPAYVNLRIFIHKYGLPISVAILLLQKGDGDTARKRFRDGTFKINQRKKGTEIAEFITELVSIQVHYRSRSFLLALSEVFQIKLDKKRLKKCIVEGIPKRVTIAQYLQEMQTAYNYGLQEKNRKLFVKL